MKRKNNVTVSNLIKLFFLIVPVIKLLMQMFPKEEEIA